MVIFVEYCHNNKQPFEYKAKGCKRYEYRKFTLGPKMIDSVINLHGKETLPSFQESCNRPS